MMPKSLRGRLPLSYAAIALIATIVLGAVLLTTLQRFYRQQELDYLAGNAQAIGEHIVPFLPEVNSGELQATIKGMAFLSQTRVRVLGRDGSLLLADSGDPRLADASTEIAFSVVVDGVERVFNQAAPEDWTGETSEATASEATIVVEPSNLDTNYDQPSSVDVVAEIIDLGKDGQTVTQSESISVTGTVTRTTIVRQESAGAVLPVFGTQFGYGFANQAPPSTAASDLVVRQPIEAEDGRLLGYVELSQGPAYGRDILQSTFFGWVIASLVAVFLAGLAGWLMSRRLVRPLLALTTVTAQMATGQLGARASVRREDELGTLSHAFNQMAGQIEEKIMALRHFVADAAHELHTPLTALQTDLHLLEARADPLQQKRLTRAQNQAQRLQELADSLLVLSRLEAETGIRKRPHLSLTQLVQSAGESYASQAEQAHLDFEMRLPQQSVLIPGDESQLRRALVNVLDNSLKFTPSPGEIVLSLAVEGDTAVVSVRDSGIGIPPDDVPQLFSRFHRGRNSAAYPGSGLGLAIVQEIMVRHNGRVTIESGGWGTEVRLILPEETAME